MISLCTHADDFSWSFQQGLAATECMEAALVEALGCSPGLCEEGYQGAEPFEGRRGYLQNVKKIEVCQLCVIHFRNRHHYLFRQAGSPSYASPYRTPPR